MDTGRGRIAVGWPIVEDLVMVPRCPDSTFAEFANRERHHGAFLLAPISSPG